MKKRKNKLAPKKTQAANTPPKKDAKYKSVAWQCSNRRH